MNKKIILCSLLTLSSPAILAMQPMDDQSLAKTTGQDGITLGVKLDKVNFKQAALIDTDGFSTSSAAASTYTNRGGFVFAGNSASPVTGVEFIQGTATSNSPTLKVVMDTDAGAGQPFVNLGISFGDNTNGIRVLPFSVYMAGSSSLSAPTNYSTTYAPKSIFSAGTTLNTDVTEILRSSGPIDINFVQANKPKMMIQLGHTPQGAMVRFGGAIQSICSAPAGCPITLVSGNTGLNFGLKFAGTNPSTGFVLDGFYAGVNSTGLTIGNTGTSSKFDASLNNVIMGNVGAQSSNVFNNLPNGSIGNIGVVGASVTDFKMKVSGL